MPPRTTSASNATPQIERSARQRSRQVETSAAGPAAGSRQVIHDTAAIIITVWWDRNDPEMPADGKRKVSFPWFMLGFIGASIIGTFVPFIGAIAPNLVDFAYIVLGMAMAAHGINVNFSAIAKKGQKAFLASFLTSVLLMCFAAGIAALFF